MEYSDVSEIVEIIRDIGLVEAKEAVCYTSIDGFLGILKDYNKDRSLNFLSTNYRYSNDRQEFLAGYNALKDSDKEKIKGIYTDVYILCFCDNSDLLSQWNRYGSTSGISIKIDFTNVKISFWDKIKHGTKTMLYDELPFERYLPRKVRYKRCEDKGIKDILKDLMCTNIFGETETDKLKLNALMPFIKDSAFEDEAESRLLFWPINDVNKNIKTQIKYRTLRNIIAPYIEVNLSPIDKKKNIIKQIVIGPGSNQREVFNAVVHMLETNRDKYTYSETDDRYITDNEIEIKTSKIPYRAF